MLCDTVLLPAHLKPRQLENRCAAVFDVLRATTTMTAALAAGVREIHLFASLDEARAAVDRSSSPRLLCGEQRCVKPPGFDLGNSPGQFDASHAGAAVLMCTTNGTRALLAARAARLVLVAGLVNASAVARRIVESRLDAVMICAATDGGIAMEDLLGAGAVMDALMRMGDVSLESDVSIMAFELFRGCRDRLPEVLRTTRGGRNVIDAGLTPDIDFASRLDAFEVVGIAAGDPLIVRPG